MNEKKKTVALGLVFLACLALAYVENKSFFNYVKDIIFNPPLAILVVFIHNVLAVSLILVGMTFYVDLVLNFLPKRKYEYLVLQHPRLFAVVFTVIILIVSIFRAGTLLQGQIVISTLPLVILVSAPNGIIEGYGIFQCIQKTLRKNMTIKDLAVIYSLFFVAAVFEVGYVQVLRMSL